MRFFIYILVNLDGKAIHKLNNPRQSDLEHSA